MVAFEAASADGEQDRRISIGRRVSARQMRLSESSIVSIQRSNTSRRRSSFEGHNGASTPPVGRRRPPEDETGLATKELQLIISNYGLRSSIPQEQRWQITNRVKIYGIREDFYAMLLSSNSSWIPDPWAQIPSENWNSDVRRLAAASARDEIYSIGNFIVQCWSKQLGQLRLGCTGHSSQIWDTPSSIAHSKLGYLLVAYQGGVIVVRDLLDSKRFAIAHLGIAIADFYRREERNSILFQSCRKDFPEYFASQQSSSSAPACVTHAVWLQQSYACGESAVDKHKTYHQHSRLNHKIEGILGDQNGRVFKFTIERAEHSNSLKFVIAAAIPPYKFHKDSICSLALDSTEQHLAVAGTDSLVRLWKHDASATNSGETFQFVSELPQFSAIRAITFCPVLPSMLITGGGRHDRRVRVFDTTRGRALFELAMPAQIVGLVFVSKYELFVALGHSRLNKYRGLGKVINVLSGEIIAEIPSNDGYLLTALKTQNGFCANTSEDELITFSWDGGPKTPQLKSHEAEAVHRLTIAPPTLR